MDEFAWSRTQAVLYNNLFYAGLAVIAIASFVTAKILTKWYVGVILLSHRMYNIYIYIYIYMHCVMTRLSERLVWMVAMFIISFGFFALLPMGDEYPAIIPEGWPLYSTALLLAQ